jgi:glycosyltransferase involved in cell wall biosynthesis
MENTNLPFVSVCTPTFNRRPFIESMFQCFRNQTYPSSHMEWIIVDDGTDKIKDLVEQSGISQIKYFPLDQKMKLGEKRNFMHSKTIGSILVYMDDDDYYPPERVEHAVDTLVTNKHAICAGASEIYVYFKHIQQMYKSGPFGPNHATAGTFAFRRQLLDDARYDDNASLAEEKAFLKNFTIPMVQLDPLKTILVFSHIHNTFDKRIMLENKHPQFFAESSKTVDDFIRQPYEATIRHFFMNDIDQKLQNYHPGEPNMKPDVLAQISQIDEERKRLTATPQIMIEKPGEGRRPMTAQEIVQALGQQQEHIRRLTLKVRELEEAALRRSSPVASSNS